MNAPISVGVLAIAAGAGLVLQNAVMLSIAGSSSSVWAPLVFNSIVGLALLIGFVAYEGGGFGLTQLAYEFGWWLLVPGFLGTLYVLASLNGYAVLGAGPTIALLLGGQVAAGLMFDSTRAGQVPSTGTIFGSLMLVAGIVMITIGRKVP